MDNAQKKELTQPQRSQMLRFTAVVDVLHETGADEVFDRVDGRKDIEELRARSLGLLRRIMDTVPDKQRDKMARQWDCASVEIGIKRATAVGRNKEYGMFLSNAACRELALACKEKCMMCSLNRHKAKKCPLREALDEMYIDGAAEMAENGCPYQIL